MKLHNAMWPGLVGKEPNTDHPPIALEQMLDMTVAANAATLQHTGYELHEVLGRSPRLLQGPDTDPAAKTEWRQKLRPRGFSLVLMDKDGDGKISKEEVAKEAESIKFSAGEWENKVEIVDVKFVES